MSQMAATQIRDHFYFLFREYGPVAHTLEWHGSPVTFERLARINNLRQTLADTCNLLFEAVGKERASYFIHQYVNSEAFTPNPHVAPANSFLTFLVSRYRRFPRIASAAAVLAMRSSIDSNDSAALASLPVCSVTDESIDIKIYADVFGLADWPTAQTIQEAKLIPTIIRATMAENGQAVVRKVP
ncbi:hypothetical protein [Roseateles sp. MS654]|uniref:hypothetical protein n=1 Tax=Roseateles sp. MS654 TaxID=3412685 RepID=UPI003C2FE87E